MKIGVLLVASLFLISFVTAIGITGSAVNNNTDDDNQVGAVNPERANSIISARERLKDRLDDSQFKKVITEKNRIKAEIKNGECPDTCTCTGSVVKCILKDGTREMTVTAGKSGNVIIQVKGINASTQVTLYKAEDGKIYAVKKNNETKRVRMLPDQVKEKIKERLQRQLENENITLNENGTYEYKGEKEARLFFLFPVKVKINSELNSETGEVIKIETPWWALLTKDKPAESIMGASCGTVTPGQNDACCKTKGYDAWDAEAGECVFSS